MDRLNERIAQARRALGTLQALLATHLDEVSRDAAIQRFEYTFEATWKATQLCLRVLEGVEVASPKGAIRGAFHAGLLDEAACQSALAMADDRNLTSHTYNEGLAQMLAARLPHHAALLDAWITAMARKAL